MSLLGIGTTVAGAMYNEYGNQRQNRQQRDMMGLQYGNQRKLNNQGHRLQMDMWNKTNYGAQVDHMKEAGLNPALMYGGAGQGGQTGSQGGGSAGSGGAPKAPVMDMSNMLMGKQADLLDAQKRKTDAETEAIGGYRRGESEGKTVDYIASAKLKVTQREEAIIRRDILQIDKDFFKEHGLAPSDFGVVKMWKRAGKDLKDALKWLLNASAEEKNEVLALGLDMGKDAVAKKINEIMNRNKEL